MPTKSPANMVDAWVRGNLRKDMSVSRYAE
jgi:hypothetical protein